MIMSCIRILQKYLDLKDAFKLPFSNEFLCAYGSKTLLLMNKTMKAVSNQLDKSKTL